MHVSVFDLFTIGIGPSSSHTVGPMRAALRFVHSLETEELLDQTYGVRCELFGSLGATGRAHGTAGAVLLGLEGETPEGVDPDTIPARLERIRSSRRLHLLARREIDHDEEDQLIFHRRARLPYHSNGMTFAALDAGGDELCRRSYFSVGGGFVLDEETARSATSVAGKTAVPLPFTTAAELLEHSREARLPISGVMLENERAFRSEEQIREGLLGIWSAMQDCVRHGCERGGELPGQLGIGRRAPELHRDLCARQSSDPLVVMDWVNLFALAVNEENAAGGRVVTAPTNGAAGIVPAVLHYYTRFYPGADDEGVIRFLLTAGAIGLIYKQTASISAAEVGCQGEVGSACSMAAGALTEVMGGSPTQVENAAEIGMEHNLGLTCDPIGGLVQIPCIERNAIAAVDAINAARLALRGDGTHFVSLDNAIQTMRQTGADMHEKYKETSLGGLAVNVVEC